ncbi:MAG TPA: hypothetical protein VGY57_01130, partial [Vicinamibacterales bacterium]|nr:hypothetical protein [Vicinamibacterales bacterium]
SIQPMIDRWLALNGAPAILIVGASLVAVPLAAQTSTALAQSSNAAAKPAWTPARTADNQPDLQGVWVNNSATPLERPKALEGRSSLTDDEVAELRRRAARLLADSNNDFAAGDNLFLAALANVTRYKNSNSTDNATAMIEREFDNRTSLILDPPDGRIPWTPEGKRRVDEAATARLAKAPAGPEDLGNEARCLTYGVPRIGVNNVSGAGTLGYYQILQTPGYVVLLYEAIHEARIIPLDGRPHLPERIRLWSGDSRGRWEGATLIVETSNFSPEGNVMGSGEHLRAIERLTRVAPDLIDYEITLDDPLTWTKPWTVLIRLRKRQELIYEYACHEGNFDLMYNILAGARADERAKPK